jgi:hypothetical protein
VLLTNVTLQGIAEGRITLVFRRWQRPTVKTGGTLRTAVGALAIDGVEVVDSASITDVQANAAGWIDAATLVEDLFRERVPSSGLGRGARSDGPRQIYKIDVRFVGGDARATLRTDDDLTPFDLEAIRKKLHGFDTRSPFGPWTRDTLDMIHKWPGRRAPELAAEQGRDTLPFKQDVRKLKELGLTQSLPVGYRLSPRGIRVRDSLAGE